jgi:Fe-S-cluster-containing dehydrogenase component
MTIKETKTLEMDLFTGGRSLPTGHRATEQTVADQYKGPIELEESAPNPSRRRFLGVMGGAAASASLAGCIRKPVEKIFPHTTRPEDLIPGNPLYFATVTHVGDAVLGLLVESQDGRPTKIEGNPNHPMSRGKAGTWTQATVMDLYDGDRAQKTTIEGDEKSQAETDKFLSELRDRLDAGAGAGLAVLTQRVPSPTLNHLLATVRTKYPKARLFQHDPMHTGNAQAGMVVAGVSEALKMRYALDKAAVILAVDSDFLHTEGDVVKQAGDFAAGRRLDGPNASMNRLYAVEANFSGTGAMADHRLRLRSGDVGAFLVAVASRLSPSIPAASLPKVGELKGEKVAAWVDAVAADLLENKGASAVVVGARQPPQVHALGHLINRALGNTGVTVLYSPDKETPDMGSIQDLADAVLEGSVQQLVILGGNPCYDAPADLGLSNLVKQVPLSIHLSAARNETSELVNCHIPESHYLEAWGDLRASDGTMSVQQPLIAPLYASMSAIELLHRLTSDQPLGGYQIVQGHWLGANSKEAAANFDATWRKWVHDGLSVAEARHGHKPGFAWDGVAAAWSTDPNAKDGDLEFNFVVDNSVADGRFSNNPWLQELPDTMTKLAWDNALQIGPSTARHYGVASGDMLTVSFRGRSMKLPAMLTRGLADNALVLSLGYGKAHGSVGGGVGFNANILRTSEALFFGGGATIQKIDGNYSLAVAQKTDNQMDRHISRESSLEDFREEPRFVEKHELIKAEHIKSLWEEPPLTGKQQWGMSIDLTACNGCNACSIACYAENNIQVVGKEEMLNGRELSWIRMDRYYEGDEDDPQAVIQPMACGHCETAPCENVCPVQATAHSPEGLNDMAYNRCIGTRYCANNCPYKVRRFNFFNYTKRNHDLYGAVAQLQRNPDVSMRFRGVMEKCTYCVQRITEASIKAKREGDGIIPDGEVSPACEQTCPTGAIVFGDIKNEESRIAKLKKDPRDYSVLAQLNIRPRTTYLAQIRNPNPRLS